MRASQVRLEPDVVAALRSDPAVDGLSLSAASNRALRAHYGTNRTPTTIAQDGPQADPASRHHPGPSHAADGPTTPDIEPAVVRGPARSPGSCRRCGRRRAVGDRCGWCGAPL